ncbi:MAG: DJ-1/PfpI family protein [Alphaproteobacteria bacterium]|nr:DJ-1/PfpI family protein [Alphaproteobacteria bacterium]
MQIAVLTFDGFNELDSFMPAALFNRLRPKGWQAHITSPTASVTSMNGVVVQAQQPLAFAATADAVVIGSGINTRAIATDPAVLAALRLDPGRQVIASQCSGALVLAALGLLAGVPACTDLTTRPWLEQAGVAVLDTPFAAHGNIATAGGCLAAQYLAAWMIARLASVADARDVLHYVAPVGEKQAHVDHAINVITPFLGAA